MQCKPPDEAAKDFMSISRRAFLRAASGVAALGYGGPLMARNGPPVARVAYKDAHVRREIDGFGFSEAFQQAGVMRLLSDTDLNNLLNLMFFPAGGMGYSILRNQIGDEEKPRSNAGES